MIYHPLCRESGKNPEMQESIFLSCECIISPQKQKNNTISRNVHTCNHFLRIAQNRVKKRIQKSRQSLINTVFGGCQKQPPSTHDSLQSYSNSHPRRCRGSPRFALWLLICRKIPASQVRKRGRPPPLCVQARPVRWSSSFSCSES